MLTRLLAAYLRAFPGSPGRWRLVPIALRRVRSRGTSMGTAMVTTYFGFKMRLQLDDWVDQHIYATGNFEDETASTIEALLEPGDVCVDVGANIGFFTLLMARCVGPSGSVWAFEPSPTTRARLLRNVQLNQLTQVTVREEAVSNADGQRLFFGGADDHSGIASLRPLQAGSRSYEVQTCTLTACFPASLAPRLIKIDIEGAEALALEGMRGLLEARHPDLVIEVTDPFLKEMGSSGAQLHAFLAQLGYSMYRIDWDGLVRFGQWDPNLASQFNALFTVRKELPARLHLKT